MTMRRAGLGRGLGSLIPGGAVDGGGTVADPRIPTSEVALEQIEANPWQPRTGIDAQRLAELAQSIRAHGVIQPLLVSETEERLPDGRPRYQLIAGERRFRAAAAAGLERVPVTVRQTTPQELLELAIIENVQRADLNPIEEALAYERLMTEFGLTQVLVSERVGKSRAAVANLLRLVELPEAVRESVARGEISEGHGRALLGIPSAEGREAGWRRVTAEGLNVRQTERMVRGWGREAGGMRSETTDAVDERGTSDLSERLEQAVQRSLGTKTILKRAKSGRGTLTIHFYSDEELEGVIERLLGDEEAL
jgi:ParB family transcriptional regulator, chromosome partitioning protein